MGGRVAANAALLIDLPSALYLRIEGSAMLWLVERRAGESADPTSHLTPLFAPRFELGVGWHL